MDDYRALLAEVVEEYDNLTATWALAGLVERCREALEEDQRVILNETDILLLLGKHPLCDRITGICREVADCKGDAGEGARTIAFFKDLVSFVTLVMEWYDKPSRRTIAVEL